MIPTIFWLLQNFVVGLKILKWMGPPKHLFRHWKFAFYIQLENLYFAICGNILAECMYIYWYSTLELSIYSLINTRVFSDTDSLPFMRRALAWMSGLGCNKTSSSHRGCSQYIYASGCTSNFSSIINFQYLERLRQWSTLASASKLEIAYKICLSEN